MISDRAPGPGRPDPRYDGPPATGLRWRRHGHHGLVFGAGAIAAGVIAGIAAGRGYGALMLGLCIVLVALAVGIHNWRWSFYGLLLYLPISGLPIILAYPHTSLPNLLKDFLFVLQLYIGFASWMSKGGAPTRR